MKAIHFLLNSVLPEDLQDPTRSYDSKSVGTLMRDIARKYPDRYEELSQQLADIGRHASYHQGESLLLDDLKPVIDKQTMLTKMDAEVEQAKKDSDTPEEFEKARNKIWIRNSDNMERMTQKAALAQGNNLAYSVVSGARGKPAQLKAMLTTPGIFEDYKGGMVPMFIRHSFGEGLRPAEYLASTAGTRKSVISTKSATARGGDQSKIMVQAAAPLIVTTRDCGASNGVELPIEENSLRGRILARDVDGLKAGQLLDEHSLAQLRHDGVKSLVARSSQTCQARDGVCAKCVGQWAGKFPHIGDSVGITAAQSIGEPITQMALNSKHTAGMASGRREFSGFDVISQFTASPETFPDRAAVAEEDGTVTGVEKAPQGGHYIHVNDKSHYVLPGYEVMVKQHDKVEAGDQLSDGLVDPGDIVRLRGLGEGRQYYVDRLSRILSDSGMPADRRNVEMLSRAALNHVVIDDPEGMSGALPDDVVSYNKLLHSYNPPEDTRSKKPHDAVGEYLQTPALHYTIGTRITKRIADHLSKNDYDVHASPSEPKFRPEMTNLRTASHYTNDWLASQHTSYLRKHLNEDAIRGEDTDVRKNVHFAPRLAAGTDFGKNIEQTGSF